MASLTEAEAGREDVGGEDHHVPISVAGQARVRAGRAS